MQSSIKLVRQLVADIQTATWMLVSFYVFRTKNGSFCIFTDYTRERELMNQNAALHDICNDISSTDHRVGKWIVEDGNVYRIPDTQLFAKPINEGDAPAQVRQHFGQMEEDRFFQLCETLLRSQLEKNGFDPDKVAEEYAKLIS